MDQVILQKLEKMDGCRAFAVVQEWVYMEVPKMREKLAGEKRLDVEAWDKELDGVDAILDVVQGKIMEKLYGVLVKKLEKRFGKNMHRHADVKWEDVAAKMKEWGAEKLKSLRWMEKTGGKPDVVVFDGKMAFVDMSEESPEKRGNCVYDAEGEKYLREKHPGEICNGNAVDMARDHGVEILDEVQYRAIQNLEKLDIDSWSWLLTPEDIRKSGDALNGNRFEDEVYVAPDLAANYHTEEGAFRAVLWV